VSHALVVAGLVQRSPAMFTSIAGMWLPLALIFFATWLTGLIMSTLPWPRDEPKRPAHAASASGMHR
jgi:hypothetical protein